MSTDTSARVPEAHSNRIEEVNSVLEEIAESSGIELPDLKKQILEGKTDLALHIAADEKSMDALRRINEFTTVENVPQTLEQLRDHLSTRVEVQEQKDGFLTKYLVNPVVGTTKFAWKHKWKIAGAALLGLLAYQYKDTLLGYLNAEASKAPQGTLEQSQGADRGLLQPDPEINPPPNRPNVDDIRRRNMPDPDIYNPSGSGSPSSRNT